MVKCVFSMLSTFLWKVSNLLNTIIHIFNENENDHQLQITDKFTKMCYILSTTNVKNIVKKIEELKEFKPVKYKSNNKKMITKLEQYIDNL